MDYETGIRMVDTHCCAQCGGRLSWIWDGEKNDYALVCGQDRSHQGYQRQLSVATAVARGKGDEVIGKGAQSDVEKQLARAGHPLSMLPTADIATGKAIELKALEALVKWGVSLGLKPYLGHVCLYHGKPYVTIDGYYYTLVSRQTQIRTGTRAMTARERQDCQIPEGAHAWLAEGWLGDTKLPTTGLGIVPLEEINEPSKKHEGEFASPVAHDKPQRMAEKRAEWQLLRKLVPLEET